MQYFNKIYLTPASWGVIYILNKNHQPLKLGGICIISVESSEEYSKDSIQFESPTCGRDTVKAILSLVPDNHWTIKTFDVSSAFFQGDTLERDVYVKNPEGPGFWVLNATLYGLREGEMNWYARFHSRWASLLCITPPKRYYHLSFFNLPDLQKPGRNHFPKNSF